MIDYHPFMWDPESNRRKSGVATGLLPAGDVGPTRRPTEATRADALDLFANASRLACAIPQIIELGTPHFAASLNLNLGNRRTV